MHGVLRTLLGFIVGSVVNMSLILAAPAPPGADMTSMEGLQAAMELFQPKHFVVPFLAHALGTLVGALTACWLAPVPRTRADWPTIAVGVVFSLGGLTNALMLPGPMWFEALDLIAAYFPMVWLALALLDDTRKPSSGKRLAD